MQLVRRSLFAAVLCANGCVAEVASDSAAVLPEDAAMAERFISADAEFAADEVIVELPLAYRQQVSTVTTPENHSSSVTPTRIELVNRGSAVPGDPVVLAVRNLRIEGRERIDVSFSDAALDREDAPLIRILGKGLARFQCRGLDVVGERVVIEDDRVRAFGKDGREFPVDDAGR